MSYFEKVSVYKDVDFNLPIRKTKRAAGYDFEIIEDIVVPSYLKNLFKLISARLTDEDFLAEIESSKLMMLVQYAKNIKPDDPKLMLALVEFLPIIQERFQIDFSDVKSLVKESDAKLTLVPTGVKVKLEDDEYLGLSIRSSIPLNSYLMLGNPPGIIDADYYNNVDNEGHIYFQIINFAPFDIKLKKGDIIGQGVIQKYYLTEDDVAGKERTSGFGSTSR